MAFFGGSWLGRFVVAGVDINGAPSGESRMEQAAAPAFVHNGPANAVSPRPAVQAYSPAEHVCEGCDAGATRDRQLAQQLGLPVDEKSDQADTGDRDEADSDEGDAH